MASRTLPGIGLTGFWDLGASDWKPGMDDNMLKLSVLVQGGVLSRTIDLPAEPGNGETYIVKADAASNANEIAVYDDAEWVYYTPEPGWRVWVVDTEELAVFDGTGWVAFTGGSSTLAGLTDVDVDTTPPTENQALTWNADNNKWEPGDVGGSSISDLSDVDLSTAPTNGQVLIYDSESGTWKPDDVESASTPPVTLGINEATADYTLTLADGDQVYVRLDSATAITLTVPANADVAFPIGTSVPFRQVGVGQVTVVAGSGVTITTPETLKLRKQHSGATLIKVATDSWDLIGDLEVSA